MRKGLNPCEMPPTRSRELAAPCENAPARVNLKSLPGVLRSRVGYTGGDTPAPTYHSVCRGDGHIEAVRIEFDPDVLPYESLLALFLSERHTKKAKRQYSSAVWTHDKAQLAAASAAISARGLEGVVTVYQPSEWHDAEEYHQDYYAKNSGASCPR
ncbi:peptide methionine sulfoxide reductase MsrA [Pavlovales sp. CCMP2436]|nr:peptide methionine sulfoxide reductase MsrA [Pavlovales sp. CCMP2436]